MRAIQLDSGVAQALEAQRRKALFELSHPAEPGYVEVRSEVAKRIQNEVALHYPTMGETQARLLAALPAMDEQVYAKLDVQAPKPDLVVYLQAPADVLLERIARRSIAYEQYIERDYLVRLNEAYARFFHEFAAAPLLIVNAAAIDPINNPADYDELLGAIRRMKRGRLYYNPMRSKAPFQ